MTFGDAIRALREDRSWTDLATTALGAGAPVAEIGNLARIFARCEDDQRRGGIPLDYLRLLAKAFGYPSLAAFIAAADALIIEVATGTARDVGEGQQHVFVPAPASVETRVLADSFTELALAVATGFDVLSERLAETNERLKSLAASVDSATRATDQSVLRSKHYTGRRQPA